MPAFAGGCSNGFAHTFDAHKTPTVGAASSARSGQQLLSADPCPTHSHAEFLNRAPDFWSSLPVVDVLPVVLLIPQGLVTQQHIAS
jgi:hypothetical protein